MKKLTTEEFIEKAKKVHGNKYDYSKVEYVNNKTKVFITCPIHGNFLVTPSKHMSGTGCKACSFISRRKRVFGFGICDLDINSGNKVVYRKWSLVIMRCYYNKTLQKRPSYKKCTVCEEWRLLSNFKKWFDEHYVDGWELDKDILVKGNKLYSPQTCCYVPVEINNLFIKSNSKRGRLPIGVCKENSFFLAQITKGGTTNRIGLFKTPEEAFYAYKEAKEAYIKEVADKWKEQLEPRVYEALYNYKVEITD